MAITHLKWILKNNSIYDLRSRRFGTIYDSMIWNLNNQNQFVFIIKKDLPLQLYFRNSFWLFQGIMGSTGFDSKSNWKVSRSRTEVILVNKRLHTFYTAKETTLLLHNLNYSKISLVLQGRKAGFSSKALVYSIWSRGIVNINLEYRKFWAVFENKETKCFVAVSGPAKHRKFNQEISL